MQEMFQSRVQQLTAKAQSLHKGVDPQEIASLRWSQYHHLRDEVVRIERTLSSKLIALETKIYKYRCKTLAEQTVLTGFWKDKEEAVFSFKNALNEELSAHLENLRQKLHQDVNNLKQAQYRKKTESENESNRLANAINQTCASIQVATQEHRVTCQARQAQLQQLNKKYQCLYEQALHEQVEAKKAVQHQLEDLRKKLMVRVKLKRQFYQEYRETTEARLNEAMRLIVQIV